MSALDELGGWPVLLTELLEGRDLPASHTRAAMTTILSGDATPAQLIAFVVALRAKGESPEELSGLLDAVLAAATPVPLSADLQQRAIDIVGTGGDRSHSINVSTMAAIVTAGAGVPVCKHGARAASSKCGTADVLEELGVAIELPPAGVVRCVEEAGIGFCLAQRYHPAFRFAAPARREIGIPTVFNLLGPMANPGRIRHHLIGVANPAVAARMLASLRIHGAHRAWVVHGNGLDELTTTGTSTVLALEEGEVKQHDIDARELGFTRVELRDLIGGDALHNAGIARQVLSGETGPVRDIVLLNAAGGLVANELEANPSSSSESLLARLEKKINVAAEAIDSGAAVQLLEHWARATQVTS